MQLNYSCRETFGLTLVVMYSETTGMGSRVVVLHETLSSVGTYHIAIIMVYKGCYAMQLPR
jgi:hypothetical protein